jgi:hypothetical protein
MDRKIVVKRKVLLMITELTQAQLNLLPVELDDYLGCNLSTIPVDHTAAETAMAETYRSGGLEPPHQYIWCNSPVEAAEVASQQSDSVRDQVRTWDYIQQQVRDQVSKQVWDKVWNHTLRVQELSCDEVWNKVWAQAIRQDRKTWFAGCDALWGQHDADWVSLYTFFQRIGVSIPSLKGLNALCRTCGWWWTFKNVAIMLERPSFLKRDNVLALHCETGPAIAWKGFAIWAWHGTVVPQFMIESPHEITTSLILGENNQEVRRVMLERYGWDRLLTELEATTLDTSRWGTLLSTDKLSTYLEGEDAEARFVLVQDPSTGRKYALRVDPSCKDAHEAVAWTFGKTAETYIPIQEA